MVDAIVEQAKAHNWTPELFKQINDSLNYTNVFRILRQELTEEEYRQLDFEYCAYMRPDQKELNRWLMERKQEEVKKQYAREKRSGFKYRSNYAKLPANW